MPQINQLSSTDSLSAGDTLVVYVNSNGDTRKASMSTITEYIESNITLGKPEFVKQKVSPSATGQTIQINDNSNCRTQCQWKDNPAWKLKPSLNGNFMPYHWRQP